MLKYLKTNLHTYFNNVITIIVKLVVYVKVLSLRE